MMSLQCAALNQRGNLSAKLCVPWLDITLEQFLEIARGARTLFEFFFRNRVCSGESKEDHNSYNARSNVAGVLEEYGKERPSTSKTELMVLALHIPRQ
jgi:hypothetical protein